jgi:hypothetical protein
MEEKTIRSISPLPFGLMMGAISAVIAFIAGIIFALIWLPLVSVGLTSASTITPIPGVSGIIAAMGVLMVIIFPIIGFIAGFIQGLIYAAVYNFLAPRIGGIKIRFQEASQAPQ